MLCEALPPKKEFHSTLVKERMQNKRHNLSKTEQSAKTNFFEALKLLRWIWPKIMKVVYISQEYALFFSEFFEFSTGR